MFYRGGRYIPEYQPFFDSTINAGRGREKRPDVGPRSRRLKPTLVSGNITGGLGPMISARMYCIVLGTASANPSREYILEYVQLYPCTRAIP